MRGANTEWVRELLLKEKRVEAKETGLSKLLHKTSNPLLFAEYLKAKAVTDTETICKRSGEEALLQSMKQWEQNAKQSGGEIWLEIVYDILR